MFLRRNILRCIGINYIRLVGFFSRSITGKKTVLCVLGDQRFQPTSNQVETDGKSLVVTAVVCCDLCLLASMFSVKQKQNGKLLVLFQCAQYRSNGKICKHANRRKAAEIAQHFENWLPSVYPESEHR